MKMLDLKKRKFFQIAINGELNDSLRLISKLPKSEKLIIEAGTPFLKKYGMEGLRSIVNTTKFYLGPDTRVIADMKTIDRAKTEIEMVVATGANGIICMADAPTATVRNFLKICKDMGVISYLDFMGIKYPHKRLREIKVIPDVVLLHRGVDEENDIINQTSFPIHQINGVKAIYNVAVAIAGGDSEREVTSAFFNSANIVILWKQFLTLENYDEIKFIEMISQVK